MSRFTTLTLAGAAVALTAGTFGAAQAAPLLAATSAAVAGSAATVDQVRWRGGGYYGGYRGGYGYRSYGHRGYGYRRGIGAGGALAAGAALGIIGGAIAAGAA